MGGIATLEKTGDRRRARWLDKNSFMLCQPALRSQHVFIADYIDPASRFDDRRARLLPARWISDSNRRGDRFRLVDYAVVENRCGADRLEANHRRQFW